jgi:hypothetical protein
MAGTESNFGRFRTQIRGLPVSAGNGTLALAFGQEALRLGDELGFHVVDGQH